MSIIQHKTKKPLTLPIPDAVGWAVIDYIKNGKKNGTAQQNKLKLVSRDQRVNGLLL